jgi:hypothetical protein
MQQPKVVVTTIHPFAQSQNPTIKLFLPETGDPEIRWDGSYDTLPVGMARVFLDALNQIVLKAETLMSISRIPEGEPVRKRKKRPA